MFGKRKPKSDHFPDLSNDLDADYLDGIESELDDFGTTGGVGFADAWSDADRAAEESGADDKAANFGSDKDDDKGRNLNRSSRRGIVALALVVALGVGLGVAAQQGAFDGPVDEADLAAGPTVAAPGTIRIYEAEPTSISIDTFELAEAFRAEEGDLPRPVDAIPSFAIPRPVEAGVVFWAGRLHVAVSGTGISNPSLCVILTLVTTDLVVIDIAATGDCPAQYGETGDRLACRGDDVVMLEVWPSDPASTRPTPSVATVRVRVETTEANGQVASRRGSLALRATERPVVDAATTLGGAPNTVVSLTPGVGGQSVSCELIDRADDPVQLLTS